MSQTNAPTNGPTTRPTRPSGPVKDESGINWDNKETINKYLVGPQKDNQAIEGANFPQTCANPPPFTMGDVLSKAEELAQKMGGGDKCVKSAKTFAEQQSKSSGKRSDWYSETAVNLDSWLVDMNASHKMGGSNTETNQESESRMGSDNLQSGCGSLMITANNVAFKQSQMQCSITNNTDKKEKTVSSTATVNVISTALTKADQETLLQMKKELKDFANQNNENIRSLTLALTSSMMEEARRNNEESVRLLEQRPNDPNLKVMSSKEMMREVALLVAELIKPMGKFLKEQLELFSKSIDVFQKRKIILKNSKIIAKAGSNISTFDKYDDETVTKMEALSNSIQKDVAAQEIANEMGVSAMDPSVKSLAQSSVDSQSSSASTAIKNTIRSSKLSMNASGVITLSCPGVIEIINSTLDASAVNELIAETVVKQSVANGQSASAKTAADSEKGQAIQNKVAGLDKLQEKLGDSIANAIKAGNDPINKAIQADVDKTKEREKSFRAALPGGSNSMIIIGVVVLVALYLLFGGGGGGGGGGGAPIIIQSKMRPFRFQFKK